MPPVTSEDMRREHLEALEALVLRWLSAKKFADSTGTSRHELRELERQIGEHLERRRG